MIVQNQPGICPSVEDSAPSYVLTFSFAILGMLLNVASIYVGNFYIMTAAIAIIAFLPAVLIGRDKMPLIAVASVLSANPLNLPAAISLNLVFIGVVLFINIKRLFAMPLWVYLLNVIAFASLVLSSLNWLFTGTNKVLALQMTGAVNYLLAPALLLPAFYFWMSTIKDTRRMANGILYFFIMPTTLLLFAAYYFGKPVLKTGELDPALGYMNYMIGKTYFAFARTQVGFILASMICAAVAVFMGQKTKIIRLLTGGSLAILVFLLLVTGSVASTIACICGICLIFSLGSFKIPISKFIFAILSVFFLGLLIWEYSDPSTKKYIKQRYEYRFGHGTIKVDDREQIWKKAVPYILSKPEGIGWSLFVKAINAYPHNDYITYTIAYGLIGGIFYIVLLLRIGLSLLRKKVSSTDPFLLSVRLAGIGVLVVVIINSVTDHLTANRWYYNVIWSLLWYSFFCCRTVPGVENETVIKPVEPAI